jgi:hypothetical protein
LRQVFPGFPNALQETAHHRHFCPLSS